MLSSLRTSGWSVSLAAAFTARVLLQGGSTDASLSHRRPGQSADDAGTMRLMRRRVPNICRRERITSGLLPASFPDDQPGEHDGDRGRGGISQVDPVLRFHDNPSRHGMRKFPGVSYSLEVGVSAFRLRCGPRLVMPATRASSHHVFPILPGTRSFSIGIRIADGGAGCTAQNNSHPSSHSK
jgi:hypothetical protein